MHLLIKTSPRKVKYHAKTWGNQKAWIPANVPYLNVSNGSLGKNTRSINVPLSEIRKLINEHDKVIDYYVDYETKRLQNDNFEADSTFTADDIPF